MAAAIKMNNEENRLLPQAAWVHMAAEPTTLLSGAQAAGWCCPPLSKPLAGRATSVPGSAVPLIAL